MIPVVDQIGDVQDIAAALYKLVWQGRYNELGPWFDLVISVIGAIPEVGSLVKGVVKLLTKGLKNIDVGAVMRALKQLGLEKRIAEVLAQIDAFIKRIPQLAAEVAGRIQRGLEQLADKAQDFAKTMMAAGAAGGALVARCFRARIKKLADRLEKLAEVARKARGVVEAKVQEAMEAIGERLRNLRDKMRAKGGAPDAEGGAKGGKHGGDGGDGGGTGRAGADGGEGGGVKGKEDELGAEGAGGSPQAEGGEGGKRKGGGTTGSDFEKEGSGSKKAGGGNEPARLDPSMAAARPAERATAGRIATMDQFKGRTFKAPPPPDPGHDWCDDLGRTYDALGDGTKANYFQLDQFKASIDHHLLKGKRFTVIDMTGYSEKQIAAVRAYVDTLPGANIIRVGF